MSTQIECIEDPQGNYVVAVDGRSACTIVKPSLNVDNNHWKVVPVSAVKETVQVQLRSIQEDTADKAKEIVLTTLETCLQVIEHERYEG